MGVGVETTFLRGALDKLGIEPQLEQRYEYKNAADRFQQTELTPAHRESLERLTESMFTDALAMISEGRGIETGRLREILDGGPYTAAEAREAGLVDQLGYRDQVYAAARSRVDPDAELLFADHWRPRWRPSLPRRRKGHVALVQARGAIVSGRSRRGPSGRQLGSDSVVGPAAGRTRGRPGQGRAVAGGLAGGIGGRVGDHLAGGLPGAGGRQTGGRVDGRGGRRRVVTTSPARPT